MTIECDELWSFVGDKNVKCGFGWQSTETHFDIVGVYVGSRDQEAASKLWQSLPPVYRQCAVYYTDFWQAYAYVLPKKQPKAVGKDSGQTNQIEWFNCTLRQRISRLVRKTLSFSKKLENHVGAIWIFIHHYNSKIQADLLSIMPS